MAHYEINRIQDRIIVVSDADTAEVSLTPLNGTETDYFIEASTDHMWKRVGSDVAGYDYTDLGAIGGGGGGGSVTWGGALDNGSSNEGIFGVLEDASGFMGVEGGTNYFLIDNILFIDGDGLIYLQYYQTSKQMLLGADITLVDKKFRFNNLQSFANNATAISGGLLTGEVYASPNGSGDSFLKIVI